MHAFSIDYLTDDLAINWGNSGIENFISFNASVYSSIVYRTPLIGLIYVIGIWSVINCEIFVYKD
jgi:hypothetical protein